MSPNEKLPPKSEKPPPPRQNEPQIVQRSGDHEDGNEEARR